MTTDTIIPIHQRFETADRPRGTRTIPSSYAQREVPRLPNSQQDNAPFSPVISYSRMSNQAMTLPKQVRFVTDSTTTRQDCPKHLTSRLPRPLNTVTMVFTNRRSFLPNTDDREQVIFRMHTRHRLVSFVYLESSPDDEFPLFTIHNVKLFKSESRIHV